MKEWEICVYLIWKSEQKCKRGSYLLWCMSKSHLMVEMLDYAISYNECTVECILYCTCTVRTCMDIECILYIKYVQVCKSLLATNTTCMYWLNMVIPDVFRHRQQKFSQSYCFIKLLQLYVHTSQLWLKIWSFYSTYNTTAVDSCLFSS